jgi:hypothetical protein
MNTLLEWFIKPKINQIGFEDVIHAISRPNQYAILNTLPIDQQSCLIERTLSTQEEELFINDLLTKYTGQTKTILLYGRNSCDPTPYKKQNQLATLGIREVYVYSGGMFEWLLLQDIYGEKDFATTSKSDLLIWRPKKEWS